VYRIKPPCFLFLGFSVIDSRYVFASCYLNQLQSYPPIHTHNFTYQIHLQFLYILKDNKSPPTTCSYLYVTVHLSHHPFFSLLIVRSYSLFFFGRLGALLFVFFFCVCSAARLSLLFGSSLSVLCTPPTPGWVMLYLLQAMELYQKCDNISQMPILLRSALLLIEVSCDCCPFRPLVAYVDCFDEVRRSTLLLLILIN
jgi:hypothetical protein